MKKLVTSFCLLIFVATLNGCVNRTISDGSKAATPDGKNQYGVDSGIKVKEQKRVWIWQSEFRNP